MIEASLRNSFTMKNNKFAIGLLSGALACMAGNLNAQTLVEIPTQTNTEKCATHLFHDHLMQTDPGAAQRNREIELFTKNYDPGFAPKLNAARYKIPVVVHVIHKGEAIGTGTNVSDSDIRKAIRNLNERYRRTLTGLGGVDAEIEFVLAVRDPNGNCTTGINRFDINSISNTTVKNNYLNNGVAASTGTGISDAQLKALISWNKQKYYNIYLVSEFDNNNGGSGVQGYAYMPDSHGQSQDGAAILAGNFTADFTILLKETEMEIPVRL